MNLTKRQLDFVSEPAMDLIQRLVNKMVEAIIEEMVERDDKTNSLLKYRIDELEGLMYGWMHADEEALEKMRKIANGIHAKNSSR